MNVGGRTKTSRSANEITVPTVGISHAGDLSERPASQALPNLTESGPLGVGQPQSRWQLRPQNTVLRGPILILRQSLLVHRASHVRRQSHRLLVSHADCLSYPGQRCVQFS